jgi:phosphoribosylformylglycinamidine synthase PurS subunit
MLIRVYVTLKPSVLDPQGMALQKALATLGYSHAEQVRQGKYFEIQWNGDLAKSGEREKIEKVASQILSNPVIETYAIEWPEGVRP